MAKQRTLSDGSRVILTDMKITRRLDALTDLATNYVQYGCVISQTAIDDMALLSAGVVVMNNQIKSVAAATYLVGSTQGTPFSTFYIASTGNKIASVTLQVTPSHGSAWCPDTNAQPNGTYTIPKESMLIAHVSRQGASSGVLLASYINNGVKPKLFFDAMTWQKDNFTDIDTQV